MTFFREGIPVPQNNLAVGKHGKLYHKNPKLLIWRANVAVAARQELPDDWEPYPGAVELKAVFLYDQPKSNKNPWKVTAPDVGNLDKALEDGLSGVVYVDDRQVVHHDMWKRWVNQDAGEEAGVLVQVTGLE